MEWIKEDHGAYHYCKDERTVPETVYTGMSLISSFGKTHEKGLNNVLTSSIHYTVSQ